ncbi:MAG: hypothetical protein Q8M88_08745 [Phenylobacterium sp.]|uniref:hypothetical protein n=1 Tax=Phenylobacterium sp. TaxID=1871053 RepID=UPI0027366AC6|nr:hypothetical protein [Phenylobacterium sp.]MDP3174506.1 hypothetical protein [Phenylobacterium sp.]
MNPYSELEAVLREMRTLFEHPMDAGPHDPARSWAPPPALAERFDKLADKIRAFEKQREFESHLHDLAPGQEAMSPLLGWDAHKS